MCYKKFKIYFNLESLYLKFDDIYIFKKSQIFIIFIYSLYEILIK